VFFIATFKEYAEWMRTAAINPAAKKSFWERLFGTEPSRPAFNRKQCKALSERLEQKINQLEQQLHSGDNANLTIVTDTKNENSDRAGIDGKIGSALSSVTASLGTSRNITRTESVQQVYKRER
jgi:hypothetical protein